MLYLNLNKGKNQFITWFEGAHFSSKCVRVSWHHFDYLGVEFEEWITIKRKYLTGEAFFLFKLLLKSKPDKLIETVAGWCKTYGIPYKTETWDTFN